MKAITSFQFDLESTKDKQEYKTLIQATKTFEAVLALDEYIGRQCAKGKDQQETSWNEVSQLFYEYFGEFLD
jgi:hypothetical protein